MSALKIAVVTQNDDYAIPRNFKLLCAAKNISVQELIVIKSASSLENKKFLFFRGFGVMQSTKMLMMKIRLKLRSVFASRGSFFHKPEWLNLRGLCDLHKIPFSLETDVNSEKVLMRLRNRDLDAIVSFSAPIVFKDDLLKLTRYGCINLHCSALPAYAGLMPSFWVLSNGEEATGVSVHLMDSKIDNGEVLGQKYIDISRCESMLEVIQITKSCGGLLMIDVLEFIHKNKRLPDAVDTSHNEASYFSWPTVLEVRALARKGKRLI